MNFENETFWFAIIYLWSNIIIFAILFKLKTQWFVTVCAERHCYSGTELYQAVVHKFMRWILQFFNPKWLKDRNKIKQNDFFQSVSIGDDGVADTVNVFCLTLSHRQRKEEKKRNMAKSPQIDIPSGIDVNAFSGLSVSGNLNFGSVAFSSGARKLICLF